MSTARHVVNQFGQPIGWPLPDWCPPPIPPHEVIQGHTCRLVPLDPQRHAGPLFAAITANDDGRKWTYLPYGPFENAEQYRAWMNEKCASNDPLFFAIYRVGETEPSGVASYLRIMPHYGSIEVGHLLYGSSLERSAAATEAMYLMMKNAFALGYRRYEWKCDALNAKSRAAALRLGFTFEGIFRQASVYKGRTRDTAWFAIIDSEWPDLEQSFQRWLDPANFDAKGRQRTRLSELTAKSKALGNP